MSDTPRPYAAYRDTGVAWLPSIPAHWGLTPGRGCLISPLVRNTGLAETRVLSLSYGKIVTRNPAKLRGLLPASFETYQIVEPGDTVIRPTDLQNDRTSLRVGQVVERGIITSAYLRIVPRGTLTADYAYQVLNTYDLLKIYYGMGSGLRQNLDFGDFKSLPIPQPPADEQMAIVKYVRNLEREVSAAVQKKLRLISLLLEKKKTTVNQAVTRGLKPGVGLKDSGCPWGESIPAHWAMVRIKRLFEDVEYGTSQSPEGHGPVRVLTMGNIRHGRVVVPETGNALAASPGLTLRHHDLLFNRTNSPDLVGKVGLYDGPDDETVSFASYLVRFRPRREYSARWLCYVLNSSQFWAYARGHALLSLQQANLNPTRYGQLTIPLPPLDEREDIARYLHRYEQKVDSAIRRTEREVALLREYQKRLIADVVTGKVDVRAAAAALSDADLNDPALSAVSDTDGNADELDSDLADAGLPEEAM